MPAPDAPNGFLAFAQVMEDEERMTPDELAALDAHIHRLEQAEIESACVYSKSLAETATELAEHDETLPQSAPASLTKAEVAREHARNIVGGLEAEKKARRAAGKADFEKEQAAKPKKHPDEYRYGAAGRTRVEIEQYRREHSEEWNEYQRARYAVNAAKENREVREYRRDIEEQIENRRTVVKANVAKHRAALTDEQKAAQRLKDRERKRLKRAADKAAIS